MKSLKEVLLGWPDGFLWKKTESWTLKVREEKFRLFMELITPRSGETILDVGVAPYTNRGTNFLEKMYPYPERITALSNDAPERYRNFETLFPGVKLVFGDARHLDYPDDHFDIVFSNAVIEHAGEYQDQYRLVHEIIRVARRAFITTPNHWFPIDSHTLIPLAHWLPVSPRERIYSLVGLERYADPHCLNLVSEKEFLSLFPKNVKVTIYKQRIMCLTSSLIALVEKK